MGRTVKQQARERARRQKTSSARAWRQERFGKKSQRMTEVVRRALDRAEHHFNNPLKQERKEEKKPSGILTKIRNLFRRKAGPAKP